MTWGLGLAVAYITVVSWTACLLKAAALADEEMAKPTLGQTESSEHNIATKGRRK